MVGALLFLELDAHHTLLRGLAYSFTAVPVGQPFTLHAQPLIAQFGIMYTYGFVLVAPAVVGLMLIDVAVAVAARIMPQANVYFVALPLKVFVGLLLLALSLRFMQPLIEDMFGSIFRYWDRILAP
jgi:flagellar biosynthesis protein FliR